MVATVQGARWQIYQQIVMNSSYKSGVPGLFFRECLFPSVQAEAEHGGFGRISGAAYRPSAENGDSSGVNRAWERCDVQRSNGTGQR